MNKIVDAYINGTTLEVMVHASRLDASTARVFKKRCEEVWHPEVAAVSADLQQVSFLDSSGVGALLSLYRRLPSPNPSIKLRRVQPAVRAVIELLRLHRIFEIEN
jgi:anti-sigma B factor antagonist